MKTISIIIPTYKGNKSIMTTIQSVLDQNNIENIEIIVVDDNGEGSYNQIETEKVLQKYINNKDIIYVKHKFNRNGSVARNTGLKKSTGDYLIFLDDDDYLLPNYVFSQISNIKKAGDEFGLSIASGYYVREDGKGYIKRIKFSDDFLYNYLMDHNYFNTSAILIKREVVENVNGFDEEFNRHQDWEFCTRILAQTKATYINTPLFIKYAKNRNTPESVETMVEQLDFYFLKLDPFLYDVLEEDDVHDIKLNKYEKVFWNYIFSCKLREGVILILERKGTYYTIFKYLINLIKFIVIRITIGNRKVTYSYDELTSEVGESIYDEN